jgi:hypothetical protein
LCTQRDVRTQVAWGARAFELRYGRTPEGMWLPEMAVDLASLEALATAGIGLTMLSPHQARRIRPLGQHDAPWTDVKPEMLDVRRLYRCRLPSGAFVDVVFREASGSQGLAFGALLRDGGLLADHVVGGLRDGEDVILTLATDGETFGHHHRFGEMAVAYAIERWRREGISIVNPATFRAAVPPRDEVEIVEGTSWSCAHGIDRWRDDCGCRTGGPAEWTQAWRRGLRSAIDWLRDRLGTVYETEGGRALREPWDARERYVDALLMPERVLEIVTRELRAGATPADVLQGRRALEMARHALLMQTSCGWFFDDVAGVESTIVLRQAGRAIDLARALGHEVEDEFIDRLRSAESNVKSAGTAAHVYQRAVLARAVTPARIAASAVLLDRLGVDGGLPGYEIALGGGDEEVVVGVVEVRTGARTDVRVHATPPGAAPSCEAGGHRYDVVDLFPTQRGRLLRKVAADAVQAVREARKEALGHLGKVIDPLIARDPALPLELALLLGFQESDRLGAAVAEGAALETLVDEVMAFRDRGAILPVQGLTRALTPRLADVLARLPDGAGEALTVLDFAAAAGVVLDLTEAQIALARWWQAERPSAPSDDLVRLRDRLGLSPELGG